MVDIDASTGEELLADTRIGVWGLGKMGLPLAAVLADNGATVRGVDIDESVVEQVNDGRAPLTDEPDVPELVAKYGGEQLRATTDGQSAATDVDVAIILVPTVLDEEDHPKLEPVVAAASDIATGLSEGDLVILESTVPPRTTDGVLREKLETSGLTAGEDFGLAFCPERTSSGRVVKDLTESYPKIVGGVDTASTTTAAELYRAFNEPGVVEMNSATAAEAVKVFEGVYRDVNIALANELATVCEKWGLDAQHIFDAANTQPYCDIHRPGIGVGGHCIPVYPHFVTSQAEAPLLELSRSINDGMPEHTAELLAQQLERTDRMISDARLLVLGLTYRPGIPELRYAPALDLIEVLATAGAEVLANDPLLDSETVRECGATPVDLDEIAELDGIVLATGHEAYESLDLSAFATGDDRPVLVDGRSFFERATVEAAGLEYVAVGDGTTISPYQETPSHR